MEKVEINVQKRVFELEDLINGYSQKLKVMKEIDTEHKRIIQRAINTYQHEYAELTKRKYHLKRDEH